MTDEKQMVDSSSDERTINNVMRHQYRVLSESEAEQMQAIKDFGLQFYECVLEMSNERSSRELSLAKTKIEEAVMWAAKHITASEVTMVLVNKEPARPNTPVD